MLIADFCGGLDIKIFADHLVSVVGRALSTISFPPKPLGQFKPNLAGMFLGEGGGGGPL